MRGISVLIVTHNNADSIAPLLDSLNAAGVHDRVIVIDNGSTDATTDAASRAGVTVLAGENVGYAAGINIGVRATPDAEGYLILNPDLTVAPGFLEPLVAEAANPGVGIVVPKVLGPDGARQDSLRREPTLRRALGLNWTRLPALSEYVSGEQFYLRPATVDWALGAAMLVTRACLDAVGAWDESYFLYSEETDFCLRARDLGFATRYVPTSEVTHVGGGSGRSDLTHQMQILNRVRLYARRHGRPAAWCYWAATLVSEASWVARGHRHSKAAVRALVLPRSRPGMLNISNHVVPR